MKRFIRKSARSLIMHYHAIVQERYYKSLLRENNISNHSVEGESEWIDKWSVFGVKPSPVYYRLFSHYIGKNLNIVPENICHDVIEPILNPYRYTKFYSDKNIFDRLMPEGYLAKTLLRKMNGFYYDANYGKMDIDDAALRKILADSGADKLIIKPSVDGCSGVGVRCFVRNGDKWIIYDGNEELNLNYLETKYGNDFIVQEFLEQHESISHFCRTSVNTLRLTLYRSVKTDTCAVPSAIMRIGNEGSIVDNAHAGGCYVGIDVESGNLKHEVLNQYGHKFSVFNHIDFGVQQCIPFELWKKVLDFAKTIGGCVPHCRLLALDLMIDSNGNPRIVEFNVEYYSMWLFQFTVGPAFGKYTDEIIDYCKERLNTLEYQLLM